MKSLFNTPVEEFPRCEGTDSIERAHWVVHKMPTKKVAPKKKKPDKFVFEISDLKLIGQPVHKEFEGAPPAPPPHTATAHAPGWHGAPGHGIFTGRVSNVDKASGYFTVSYEDGDDEVRLGLGRGRGSSGTLLPPRRHDAANPNPNPSLNPNASVTLTRSSCETSCSSCSPSQRSCSRPRPPAR